MKNRAKFGKVYKLILSALFAAIITLSTAFLKINTGTGEGYIHLGDCFLYLSACILPVPYSLFSASVGCVIADVLSGAAAFAPFTAVIKILNVLPFVLFRSSGNKILSKKSALAPLFSGVITVIGYFFAERILYSPPAAFMSVPLNAVQAVLNAALFYTLAFSLDKINFKSRIYK